jgi:hypothetical protein
MLACGARKEEVLNPDVSEFFLQDGHVFQVGLAKKRKGKRVTLPKTILWMSPVEFLELIARIRGYVFKRRDEGKDMKGVAGSISRYSRWLWPQDRLNGNNTGTHINRAIYANCAYAKREKPEQSLTYFVKEVLGHESMTTAASYMQVAISLSLDDKLATEAKRQYDEAVGPSIIYLESRTGDHIPFRMICIRKMTFVERCELAEWTIEKFLSCDIPFSRKLLLDVGFDSKFLSKFNKARNL